MVELVYLILFLALIGFLVYLVTTYIPMPEPFKLAIIVIVVIVMILWLLGNVVPLPHSPFGRPAG